MSDTEDEDLDGVTELLHYHLQRKQRRKTRARQGQEEGEEPPIIRGLWVQEIDWLKSADREMASCAEIIPPPPQFTDSVSRPRSHADLHSCVCEGRSSADMSESVGTLEDVSLSEDQCRSIDTDDTSSTDDRGGSDSDWAESICTHESESDSSYCGEDDLQVRNSFRVEAGVSNLTFDLMGVSGFNSDSSSGFARASGSSQSLLENSDSTSTPLHIANTSPFAFSAADVSDIDTVLEGLRGRVTRMPKQFVSPFFKDLKKQTLNDRKQSVPVNEGLIFHHVRH